MTADQLKTLTTHALDSLATLLDAGHSARLTAFLKTMGRFHRYSFQNVCLITTQCPTASRVAGFHTWRTMGRFVRKGETGIAIFAPIVGRRHEVDGDETTAVLGFRAAFVFDVVQTEGKPLPDLAEPTGDPGAASAALRAAIVARGISLDVVDDLQGARGLSAGGRIQILKGLSPAEEFAVLAHEWAHELLHHEADRPSSRDTRELEAEAVAFVVSDAVGLQVGEAARDYIHLYRGNRDALVASLGRIQRAASVILGAVG